MKKSIISLLILTSSTVVIANDDHVKNQDSSSLSYEVEVMTQGCSPIPDCEIDYQPTLMDALLMRMTAPETEEAPTPTP